MDSSVITIDNLTKDSSPVTIKNPLSAPSENPTKDTSHVPKGLMSDN